MRRRRQARVGPHRWGPADPEARHVRAAHRPAEPTLRTGGRQAPPCTVISGPGVPSRIASHPPTPTPPPPPLSRSAAAKRPSSPSPVPQPAKRVRGALSPESARLQPPPEARLGRPARVLSLATAPTPDPTRPAPSRNARSDAHTQRSYGHRYDSPDNVAASGPEKPRAPSAEYGPARPAGTACREDTAVTARTGVIPTT